MDDLHVEHQEPCPQCEALEAPHKTFAPLSRRKFLTIAGTVALGGIVLAGTGYAQEEVHWSYEGEAGPEHWGELSEEFAICGSGREQSPVDIPADAPLNPGGITFNYKPTALNILNNGEYIRVNYDAGSSIVVGGKTYNLLQFHFHLPSEHALGGQLKDMELHLVHQAADGELAVVGVLLAAGSENAAYAPVFNNLPAEEQPATPVAGVTVNAADLLPTAQSFYRYDGSLTTPPCTQGVKWHVMSNTVELSPAQIAAYKAIFELDARPVQALNGRQFSLVSTLPATGGTPQVDGALVGVGLLALIGGLSGVLLGRRKSAPAA